MVRWVFRTAGVAFVVLALAAVVLDAAQSIAVSSPRLTAIEAALETIAPHSAATIEAAVRARVGGQAFDGVVRPFLGLPASVVLTAVGFLLLLAGAPRGRRRLQPE